ncbi:LWR-salt protein [Halomarina litorea]|uniref:LWR-salt protein n=1 Tax=Halomarina litorea TaxID=2961595 RepID=UPI0020C258CD|nr:LWR-salt protein [Halomarina sp. BCD28]
MTDGTEERAPGDAAYVFRVRFRLDPAASGVSLSPNTFETTLERAADPPGEEGWLFFRDNLWRGEANDATHVRDLAEEALGGRGARTRPTGEGSGITVESVSFSELRTSEAYLDALEAAIGDELDADGGTFGNARSADEVLKNYLGSSIHVRPERS